MKKFIAKSFILMLLVSIPVFGATLIPGVDAVSAATATWPATPVTPTTPEAPKPTPATPVPVKPTTPAVISTPAAVPAGSQIYVVVSGDMMWKIAAKHNLTVAQLIALNPQIKNPNVLTVGQKIVIKKAAVPATTPAAPVKVPAVAKVYEGFGSKTTFRNGPGADSEGVPVYSFNVAMARATFDPAGRIINVYIDGYEVATPNYDGASMPHFSGWPGQSGYNVTDHATEKVSGVSVNTKESAAAEVGTWQTKRQRGDSYNMNPANEWYKQMNFYQKFFVGKTVNELEAWFAKYTTTAGRPIKATTTDPTDLAKYMKLTDSEKAQLVDVVSGATMSLRDAHGDFLGAVAEAYKNRVEVVIPVK